MAETSLPLSVHIGSTPLDRLLFNCPARVTCGQLLQSVQQALPHAVLSHLSTFHHDRIPVEAEMAQYVQAHDAVIAHFVNGQQQQAATAMMRAGMQSAAGGSVVVSSPVRMTMAPSSAFGPPYGAPHLPLPPPHMMPHNDGAFAHPSMPPPPMPYMMYGPPPPSAYHPMPPAMQHMPPPPPHTSATPMPQSTAMHPQAPLTMPQLMSSAPVAISMVEACQLATQSVKPALDRYRTTHASAFLQSGNNHNMSHPSAQSPTARALLASLKRDEVKRSKKRGFQRVSGDVEAETESEGVSDDESMGSASSWSAVDDEADNDDTRAAHAAQLIASLARSPGGKRTVKLEHDSHSHSHSHSHTGQGSRLIRSTSPIPTTVFDSASLLKNKHLKHATVLVLYQAKEEQRPHSASMHSTPASVAPSSSPVSPVHSMSLSPASSALPSPATPSSKSVASYASSFSPRAPISSVPSSHATTSHAPRTPSHTTVATVAASSVPAASSSAVPAAAHFMPSPPRQRSRLGIPVMRERRRRRRRAVPVASATPGITLSANSTFPLAAAIPAMPVAAASPAKAVMAAISYVPNAAGTSYHQQQSTTAAQPQPPSTPPKERDEKRTYNGKVRVYHNVPINLRTGRVAIHN